MGTLYLLIVALMFSFGGTCAKLVSTSFTCEYITLFRFVMGVFFLLLLKLIRRQRFRPDFRQQLKSCGGWLVFGAVGKSLAYLTENYGLTHGVSYGNILTQPAQAVFLVIISTTLLHEKISRKKLLFMLPCLVGVLLVSWNGRSLEEFVHGNLLVTALFLVSGTLAGCHVLAQKKVADRMDILDSNLTMFTIAALVSLIPTIRPTLNGALVGVRPDLPCLMGILAYGFITGIAFYINAKAIPLVPFFMVPIIQSTMVLFGILWGVLFFHESVSVWIVSGAALFIFGIIGLQLADPGKPRPADPASPGQK